MRVFKTNGENPEFTAVRKVVKNWGKVRKPRGRPKGTRKTTKADDRLIVKHMLAIQGPKAGGAVTIDGIKERLPPRLKEVSRELVRTRLKEKG